MTRHRKHRPRQGRTSLTSLTNLPPESTPDSMNLRPVWEQVETGNLQTLQQPPPLLQSPKKIKNLTSRSASSNEKKEGLALQNENGNYRNESILPAVEFLDHPLQEVDILESEAPNGNQRKRSHHKRKETPLQSSEEGLLNGGSENNDKPPRKPPIPGELTRPQKQLAEELAGYYVGIGMLSTMLMPTLGLTLQATAMQRAIEHVKLARHYPAWYKQLQRMAKGNDYLGFISGHLSVIVVALAFSGRFDINPNIKILAVSQAKLPLEVVEQLQQYEAAVIQQRAIQEQERAAAEAQAV